jgi:hypothetical protein
MDGERLMGSAAIDEVESVLAALPGIAGVALPAPHLDGPLPYRAPSSARQEILCHLDLMADARK